jgi:hypothetical protein
VRIAFSSSFQAQLSLSSLQFNKLTIPWRYVFYPASSARPSYLVILMTKPFSHVATSPRHFSPGSRRQIRHIYSRGDLRRICGAHFSIPHNYVLILSIPPALDAQEHHLLYFTLDHFSRHWIPRSASLYCTTLIHCSILEQESYFEKQQCPTRTCRLQASK